MPLPCEQGSQQRQAAAVMVCTSNTLQVAAGCQQRQLLLWLCHLLGLGCVSRGGSCCVLPAGTCYVGGPAEAGTAWPLLLHTCTVHNGQL